MAPVNRYEFTFIVIREGETSDEAWQSVLKYLRDYQPQAADVQLIEEDIEQ